MSGNALPATDLSGAFAPPPEPRSRHQAPAPQDHPGHATAPSAAHGAVITTFLAGVAPAAAACVFRDAKPTLRQSLTGALPAIAAHIKEAQADLNEHWGRKTDGTPLERMYNPPQRIINRRTAGAQCRALGIIGSCDEYPYASTHQGCALELCHVDGVPRPQNTAQGGELQKFYRTQRLLDGDEFWVKVVP